MEPIKLEEKFSLVDDHWKPRVIGALNGQEVKVAKVKGTFIWHRHPAADELFWVHRGVLILEFRDKQVKLGPGEMCIVPRGVEHRPVAEEEVELLLFEPAGTRNTGTVAHDLTHEDPQWI